MKGGFVCLIKLKSGDKIEFDFDENSKPDALLRAFENLQSSQNNQGEKHKITASYTIERMYKTTTYYVNLLEVESITVAHITTS